MNIVHEYSHLGGAEILQVRYPKIDNEISEIIKKVTASREKISKEKTKMGQKLYAPKVNLMKNVALVKYLYYF